MLALIVGVVSALGGALVGAVTAEAFARRRERHTSAKKEADAITAGLRDAQEQLGLVRVTIQGLNQRHEDLLRIITAEERDHHHEQA